MSLTHRKLKGAAGRSAAQNLEFMASSAFEVMTWSFMMPNVPGEHHSVTGSVDNSFGYTHQYDAEDILKNPDGAKITSWISGWSKYHGSVLMQHHEDTIVFRDLLQAKLEQLE